MLTSHFSKEFCPAGRVAAAARIRAANKEERRAISDAFREESAVKLHSFQSTAAARKLDAYPEQLFLHTIPTNSEGRANTQMNNELVDTVNLSPQDSLSRVLAGGMSLSCSTLPRAGAAPRPETTYINVANGDATQYRGSRNRIDGRDTMYPFGVVFEKGTILSAYRNDGGTFIGKGDFHRKAKGYKETKEWALLDDIGGAMEASTNLHNRHAENRWVTNGLRIGRDINEIVVAETKPSALFLNLDDQLFTSPMEGVKSPYFGDQQRTVAEEASQLARLHPHFPLLVRHQGKTMRMSPSEDGFRTPDGVPLGELVQETLDAGKSKVTTFHQVPFEHLQTRMWADGEMPRAKEEEFLGKGRPSDGALICRDESGMTALHAAALNGRARHLPEEILHRYASLEDNAGRTVGHLLAENRWPLETAIREEADMRSTSVTPFKDGPIPFDGPSGRKLWASGSFPNGSVLCTNERGSSAAAGIDWSLPASIFRQMFTEAERDQKPTGQLEAIAAAATVSKTEFSTDWIAKHRAEQAGVCAPVVENIHSPEVSTTHHVTTAEVATSKARAGIGGAWGRFFKKRVTSVPANTEETIETLSGSSRAFIGSGNRAAAGLRE